MTKIGKFILATWIVLCLSDWFVTFGYRNFLIFGRALRFVSIFISIYISVKYGASHPNRFPFRFTLSTIAIICFCYAFTGYPIDESFYEYLKLLMWVTESLALYLIFRNGGLSLDDYMHFLRCLIWISACTTFLYAAVRYEEFSEEYNANAYLLTFCLPGLFLEGNRINRFLLTKAILLLGVLITIKKGALLCTAAALGCYLLVFNLKKIHFKTFFRTVMALLVAALIGLVVYETQKERINDRIFGRDMEQSVNGREYMYETMLKHWQNGDFMVHVFGYGDRSETKLWGGLRKTMAHSDIYGRLHNNGLIGCFMIFLIHCSFFCCVIKLWKTPYYCVPIMGWVIYTGVSVFSGTFYELNSVFLYGAQAVACGLADWEKEHQLVDTSTSQMINLENRIETGEIYTPSEDA